MSDVNGVNLESVKVLPNNTKKAADSQEGEEKLSVFTKLIADGEKSFHNIDTKEDLGIETPTLDDAKEGKEKGKCYEKDGMQFEEYLNKDGSYSVISYKKPGLLSKILNKDPKSYNIQEYDANGKMTQETRHYNDSFYETMIYDESGNLDYGITITDSYMSVTDVNQNGTRHSVTTSKPDTMPVPGQEQRTFTDSYYKEVDDGTAIEISEKEYKELNS